ncbi:MAG: 30S ribosomal protein S12 methylthiotransferase RimO [Treponema sp.]|jgi:ribosomal protein S12 methylthiotransferase|nr:30S ribosomal protein S12 methylthiotransferase RimO [Treponema sp.]
MRYFLDQFGCAKNQVDGENMMALLDRAGWSACADAKDADLIIVNSCGFIKPAKQESINAVIAWKNRYAEKKVLLAGCLAQRYKDDLSQSLDEADAILNLSESHLVAEAASKLTGASFTTRRALNSGERPLGGFPGSAYVKIAEGCNNRCSFCAIPLIRGPLHSRGINDICGEIAALLRRGVKEICLIAQDLCAYGNDFTAPPEKPVSFLRLLLEEIAALGGHFWVRLLYMHSDHFPLDILELIKSDGRFLPYFDIPVQHASPSVLGAMGRRSSAESNLKLLETIRGRLPRAVIRSTFLVGFPGESDGDFEQLLRFQKKARFDWLGVFTYSREENTPSYSMKNRVSKKTAQERKKQIEEAQRAISETQMDRFTGKNLEVLVEEKIEAPESGEDIYLGRLYLHACEVDGAAVIERTGHGEVCAGNLYPCTVQGRAGFDLRVTV